MEGGGTIAGTVKIHSPKFAPPAVGSGVVRLTWSGSQTPAAVRKLRVEGSHTRFLRSQTQRPFANFALSFWRRKVRLRQCAGPIVYRPFHFALNIDTQIEMRHVFGRERNSKDHWIPKQSERIRKKGEKGEAKTYQLGRPEPHQHHNSAADQGHAKALGPLALLSSASWQHEVRKPQLWMKL